ncbi:MAG: ATP phosphoribosyltransferase [Bacteroidales bacterium]|nr:ATP phosphoribosyltransferase [Bacteroidales bacterium]
MTKLKIALQKSGRLSDKSIELIRECGIGLTNGSRKLLSRSSNFPLEVMYLRDDDIPRYVADGVADIGIVGENVVAEEQAGVDTREELGFARCRLSLAVPKSTPYKTPADLQGKKIATSYPTILKNFFEQQGIEADIHEISGSVEIAPGIGLSDGIFDIVSTGSTLISNGLREVETVMDSQAVLIAQPGLGKEQEELLSRLLFRIRAVKKARNNKYILLNAPNDRLEEITSLIPGMKSPTVMPLADPGWSSVHSVLNENDFWDVIDGLKDKGAQGILVVPIEKMIV